MSAQLRGALFRLVHGGALRNACIFALVLSVLMAVASVGLVPFDDTPPTSGASLVAVVGGAIFYSAASSYFCVRLAMDDIAGGFAKTLLADVPGERALTLRREYHAAMLLVAALVPAAVLLVATAMTLVVFLVIGLVPPAAELVHLVLWLVLTWLVSWAYACLATVATWKFCSRSAATLWAVLVSSGLAGLVLGMLVATAGVWWGAPWLADVVVWLPSAGLRYLGAVASIPLDAGGVAGWLARDAQTLVRLLASSLGVFVISVLVTLLSASRKDVA